MNERTFTVPEVAKQLRISRGTAYELARQNRIPVIRIGKRLLVPKVEFEEWLANSVNKPE